MRIVNEEIKINKSPFKEHLCSIGLYLKKKKNNFLNIFINFKTKNDLPTFFILVKIKNNKHILSICYK